MVNQNHHPNTMKDKEIEKEKEKILKLMCLPFATKVLKGHDQALPWEITNPTGSNLIPRVVTTNIMVYAISTDIRMVSQMRHPNNIQHGVRANEVISDLDLHTAASHGNFGKAQEVVFRNRKLLWCVDSRGNLPLHLAVENGHNEVATYLVTEYPQASYALNSLDVSPLYLAVVHKDLDLVELMFSNLVGDPNVIDSLRRGKSIVRAAIEEQNQEMLETILKAQRELIKCTDEEGLTPLSYAAYNGFVDTVGYIIDKFPKSVRNYKNDDKSDPIHKACLGGHVEVLQVFHSKSPQSFLSGDCQGRTVLHIAAKERGNKLNHIVSYLLTLKEGRELLGKKDENGCTALDLARRNKNHLVIQSMQS